VPGRQSRKEKASCVTSCTCLRRRERRPSAGLTANATELYQSWKAYALAAGEEPGSQKSFADKLLTAGKGIVAKRTKKGMTYQGIRLQPPPASYHETEDDRTSGDGTLFLPGAPMGGLSPDDSAELREELDERGTRPVIPNRSNRKQPFRFSKRLYKLRWRIEAAFNRLKDFRRIATRYDRLARNYLAFCLSDRRSCMVDLMSLDPSLRCSRRFSHLIISSSTQCTVEARCLSASLAPPEAAIPSA